LGRRFDHRRLVDAGREVVDLFHFLEADDHHVHAAEIQHEPHGLVPLLVAVAEIARAEVSPFTAEALTGRPVRYVLACTQCLALLRWSQLQ
jgi:hypothetical protein